MASGLLEPPAGGPLGVFLLRDEEEEEEQRRREVGCQWENPEEDRREVGCQSDSAERRDAGVQVDLLTQQKRDAGVQVDLLTQQLSWRHTGSSAMLLQCFAVRPDGPDGGALLQHCTTTRTRTRTRPIKPTQPRAKAQKPPRRSKQGPSQRRYRRLSPVTDIQQEEEEVVEEEVEEMEEEEVEEEDAGDPTWTPPEGDVVNPLPSASALEKVQLDSDSQHASLCAVKLEPDSTVCEVCGKVMKNKSSLARHSFIHTGQQPFSCHLCELRFNRRDNLQHHLARLHPHGAARPERRRPAVPAWLCAVCGKTFSCRSRLKTHEVIHSGVKPHRCDRCPKAYMRTNDLEHHKKIAHRAGEPPQPPPSSLLCDLCGKEFRCRSQLTVHFQTHTGERPHLCDVCGRKFGRRYQLRRHKILLHANRAGGEDNSALASSPYACGVCGKRLKSSALLAAHARVHSADKPHRCGICMRGFQRAACLKQHHLRVHLRARTGDGEGAAARQRSPAPAKAFPCPVCGKVFRFRSLLASHSLVHSESRPHGCDFCSRSFRRLSHLKRHREVLHASGRAPQSFVCLVCGKDKKCRSQLARHAVVHTGERPFACELCAARFNRRGNLQQHMRRMHGVGAEPAEEAPPLLFDDDLAPVLTYKQEETVEVVTELSPPDL
ncbi:endothelial zinc finger protein induced by tumor necrosis factor alpha-like [Clinocottus analis]|uniref:endothelial zinc finger protein induced by tumor necrosis factor alpha-like n=1 Tax=Clinocottus analis TaxID=304258 RepID=UPI0035BF8D21